MLFASARSPRRFRILKILALIHPLFVDSLTQGSLRLCTRRINLVKTAATSRDASIDRPSGQHSQDNQSSCVTRRGATVSAMAFLATALTRPCSAFENGIPEMENYKSKKKYPGEKPTNLGLQTNGKLAVCKDAPNCFSTSGDVNHLLPLWKPSGHNSKSAMVELLETIQAYPPGQARIDKGGFSIIAAEPDYMYVQFESMKHGFIDDVEFAISKDSRGEEVVQVRSSSRIGYLDLGVNGKRLNWISTNLREKGWTAPAITPDEYPDYFPTLVFTFDDYIRSVLSPKDCPVPSQPTTCRDPS